MLTYKEKVDPCIAGAAQTVSADMRPVDLADHRVLVTGATGLIGRVLVETLRLRGATVGVCNSEVSLTDCLNWDPTDVIHAAGYAQPAKFTAQAMQTIDLNTRWLMALVEKVRQNDGRLLYLSTSEVYSGSPRLRHYEADIGQTAPDHPRGCYIEAKRCGEAIIHAARKDGTKAVAARVSLAYGPGVKKGDTRVVSQFIDQALRSGEIALQDGGQARRTYCYITDIAEMLLNTMWFGRSPVYNIGGEGEVTILSLARRIGGLMKATVKVPRGAGIAQIGAPAHVSLDTGLYRREFSKRHFVPLEEGLQLTIAWHKALHGIT